MIRAMAKLLLNLRDVPDDEAAEVRAMLKDSGIESYETPPSAFGISAGGIFVSHDADLPEAKRLMAVYQAQRRDRARAEYAEDVRNGRVKTMWMTLRTEPLRVVGTIVAIIVLLGLVALPAMLIRAG